MTRITYREVSERLEYDFSTGRISYKTDINPSLRCKRMLGHRAGYVSSDGYRRIVILKRSYAAHHLAWLLHNRVWAPGYIDHVNGDRDDNRIANLRLATLTQNNGNSQKRAGTSSQFKGVTKHPSGSWQAQIGHVSGNKYLGLFASEIDAAAAYNTAAAQLFGPFANLNNLNVGAKP